MNLTPETLIEDLSNGRILRVKYVDRDEEGQVQTVALFDCTAHRPEPLATIEEVTERLQHQQWAFLTGDAQKEFDRKLGHVRSTDDIRPKWRDDWVARRDTNWSLIEPAHRLGILAFEPEPRREALLSALSVTGSKCSVRWAEMLLYRFWESGNLQLSVGPQNFRAGAKSRSMTVDVNSDGKPRRRPGANPLVQVTYPDGGQNDRGGSNLNRAALSLMAQHANKWLEDPGNQHVIKVNLRCRKGLPWTKMVNSVNTHLARFEEFRQIRATRRQLQYLCKPQIDIVKVFKRCRGYKTFNLKHRALNGDYRDVARYFGQRFEVDTFIADIFLVDDEIGITIGRPRVYLIVDTFSGLVVGVYVTINETDYAHVARALHAAFSNLSEYAALFGLTIDKAACPGKGIPEEICGDNKELVAKAAKLLPEVVDVGIARAYRGDDKGTVEITSSLLQSGHIMLYREGCTEGPKGRCEDDPAKSAKVRVYTFTRELLRYVIGVHNHRVFPKNRPLPEGFLRTQLPPTPFNVAAWSLRTHGNVLRPYDARTMLPRLLPSAPANISRRGLEVNGLVFALPPDLNALRSASLLTDLASLRVHYDPLYTSQVYIVPKDLAADPIPCKLSAHSRQYLNYAWEEKVVRDNYVEGLRRLGKYDLNLRDAQAVDAQREALLKDAENLKNVFGTLRMRNAVSSQVNIEAISSRQAATDDTRHGEWMHQGLHYLPDAKPEVQESGENGPTVPPPSANASGESISPTPAKPTKPGYLTT